MTPAPPPARPLYGRWPRFSDARRSLALDRDLLHIRALPVATRGRLLWQKLRATAAVVRHRPYALRLGGGTSFVVTSMSDLGSFQATIIDVYEQLVRTGILPTVRRAMDVGANIGQWTTAVKLFSPSTEILCLEPDPDTFRRLEANVGALPGVTLRCVAAGDSGRQALLYRHELSLMSTLHAGGPGYDPNDAVEVQVDTVDSVVAGCAIDLLKVDVEGAELAVLEGASDTLAACRHLVVELSLGRAAVGSAIETLGQIRAAAPQARILALGRPMGGTAHLPACQDAVIELHPER